MKAMEVVVNGHRICLAGIVAGVLGAHVTSVCGQDRDEDLFLQVGALDRLTEEHLRWDSPPIEIGAEIMVRVIEASAVDSPSERIRYEKPACIDEYRKHLKECGSLLSPTERRQLLQEIMAELESSEV